MIGWHVTLKTTNDFVETSKKIFVQFEAKPLHEPSSSEINDLTSEIVLSTISTSKSIVDVFMNEMNSFPKVKQNASLRMSKQYIAIVNCIISPKFGVKAGCLTDYEKLVKYFSELLWEVDLHYHKLKTRGMPFLESVEKKLSWIQQASQSWTCPKTTVFRVLKFEGGKSLSVYRQKLYGFFTHETFERNFASCCRKSNCDLTQLEEQNVQTKEGHAKTCHSNTIEDFVVRNISTYTLGETVWLERFAKIQEMLQSKDVFEPIVVNEFIQG